MSRRYQRISTAGAILFSLAVFTTACGGQTPLSSSGTEPTVVLQTASHITETEQGAEKENSDAQTSETKTLETKTSETKTSEIKTSETKISDSESPEAKISEATAKDLAPEAETGSLPEQEEPPTISLVMVGDILLHTPVAESGRQEDGSYDFSALFAQTGQVIQEADLALVNQEVIIGGEELGVTGYPSFNAPYELGDALADAGFDVILHATNHALDKGKRGLVNCMDFWKTNYPELAVLGIHDSRQSQEEIYIYEQEGIRIAILNYTYGTNGISLPEGMPYAVDLLEEKRVKADLEKAGEEADFVIVCPHWGTEYRLETSSEQEKWTELFLENGADLILGTHPHVIEPVEWRTGENGEKMLVFYSLGNFVNWTSGTGDGVANRMVGGMAQVELQREESGEVVITGYEMEPLVCHLEEGTGGVTTYFLKDYTESLADRNEIREQDASFSLDYCRELCEKVLGSRTREE